MIKSGNHSDAHKSEDGEWSCAACGGESFDFELFEEYGDQVKCRSDEDRQSDVDDKISRAMRDQIRAARDKIAAVEEAAKEDEIVTKAADGSTVATWPGPALGSRISIGPGGGYTITAGGIHYNPAASPTYKIYTESYEEQNRKRLRSQTWREKMKRGKS